MLSIMQLHDTFEVGDGILPYKKDAIKEIAFGNVVCKMSAISSRSK